MARIQLPFEILEADQSIREKYFPNALIVQEGVWVGPKKYFLPPSYKEYGSDIYNFEAKQDDVYLSGYMRSGTTLHCEMVWLIGNNLDYQKAASQKIDDRFPHIDFGLLSPEKSYLDDKLSLEAIKNQRHRRFIKSHLPISLLPPSIFENGAKMIYCARNPKDVIVSNYNALNFFMGNKMNVIESFKQYFTMAKLSWGWFLPYFEHVKEAWERRYDANFLFLFYEDTIKDLRTTIVKVSDFLDRKLTNNQIDTLVNHLDFKNFKINKSVNLEHLKTEGNTNQDFIRKGQLGGWREYFNDELLKEAEDWMSDCLKGSDLEFPET